jgi:hypothetical protein
MCIVAGGICSQPCIDDIGDMQGMFTVVFGYFQSANIFLRENLTAQLEISPLPATYKIEALVKIGYDQSEDLK